MHSVRRPIHTDDDLYKYVKSILHQHVNRVSFSTRTIDASYIDKKHSTKLTNCESDTGMNIQPQVGSNAVVSSSKIPIYVMTVGCSLPVNSFSFDVDKARSNHTDN